MRPHRQYRPRRAVLVEQGIVSEITGHRRNRIFSYTEHLRTLNEGTE